MDPIEKFIIWAKDNEWTVKNKITKLNLPKDIIERYPNINQEYRQFLNVIENCVTPDETVWFLCENGYNINQDIAWPYNEFEEMDLETVDNEQEKDDIKNYWNRFMPIVFSVGGDYLYFALDTQDRSGSIVQGFVVDSGEYIVIASSFYEFLDKIMNNQVVF